jgi:HK97 family phage prohead protease
MVERPEPPELEMRLTKLPVQLRATGSRRVVGGYAAVFDSLSENLGGFTEIVDDRAFNKSAGDQWPGVMCRFQHLDTMLLGTTAARTLRLAIDQMGLFYEVDLPESRADTFELVSRGDVSGSSFAFQAYDDQWDYRDGTALRTLLSVRLIDVAPVVNPAYVNTSAGLRSLARHVGAPIEDVAAKAERNELRAFFVRTDAGSPPVPPPGRRAASARSTPDRLAQLIGRRYEDDKPPEAPRSGREALVEIQGRRWPDEDPDTAP